MLHLIEKTGRATLSPDGGTLTIPVAWSGDRIIEWVWSIGLFSRDNKRSLALARKVAAGADRFVKTIGPAHTCINLKIIRWLQERMMDAAPESESARWLAARALASILETLGAEGAPKAEYRALPTAQMRIGWKSVSSDEEAATQRLRHAWLEWTGQESLTMIW